MGYPLIEKIRQGNIVFHECVGKNPSVLTRFLWEQTLLPFELARRRIDILFTAKNLNVFFAPCKTVISIRNLEPFAYREYDNDWKLNVVSWIKWQLTTWSVRRADHIVAVSQAVKDRLAARFPEIGKNVSVVYNGNPVPSLGLRLPSPIGRGNGEGYIFTASKFVAYANQLNLLRGYAELLKRRPEAPPLWFAGGVHDKKYFRKVQKFVEDNKLGDRVKFLGLVPHDRLLELMRQARAFVFPSTLESCPHTLIEAMACGVPIVTSTTPPMSEICQEAAFYFNPNDPQDIARAIEEVLDNRDRQEALVRAGIQRAQYFSCGKTVRQLNHIFETVKRYGLR